MGIKEKSFNLKKSWEIFKNDIPGAGKAFYKFGTKLRSSKMIDNSTNFTLTKTTMRKIKTDDSLGKNIQLLS